VFQKTSYRAGGVAKVVEWLSSKPSKHDILSLSPSTTKNKSHLTISFSKPENVS
jgi:hypothetical protein